MKIKTISVFILGALLVAGCGGGGDSSNSGSGSSVNNLSLNTSPTAKLASSQSSANALATEIQNNAPRVVAASEVLSLPLAMSALPGGVSSGSIDCSAITGMGGSGSISYTVDIHSPPLSGDSGSATFNACMIVYNGVSYTLNGTAGMSFPRYSSSTDYAFIIGYSNFSVSAVSGAGNYSSGQVSGSITLDDTNGTVTVTSNLDDGSATDIASSNVQYNGAQITITSASYVYNSPAAGGIIKVDFSNWVYDTSTGKPVSGSITVTGANGDSVMIVANGSDYTVTYTISGVQTSYTVSY